MKQFNYKNSVSLTVLVLWVFLLTSCAGKNNGPVIQTPEPPPAAEAATKPDHLALARDLMEKGYYEVALGQLDAIKDGPATAERHHLKAVCLREKGDLEGARAHFKKSLAKNASYAPALDGLALSWDLAGEPEKAWPLYQKAITRNPARAEYYNNYGYSLLTAGRLGEARVQFDKSHKLDPAAPRVINNRVLCTLMEGKTNEAVPLLSKIAQPAAAHHRAGALAQMAGRDDLARDFYRRALEIDPKLEVARRSLNALTTP